MAEVAQLGAQMAANGHSHPPALSHTGPRNTWSDDTPQALRNRRTGKQGHEECDPKFSDPATSTPSPRRPRGMLTAPGRWLFSACPTPSDSGHGGRPVCCLKKSWRAPADRRMAAAASGSKRLGMKSSMAQCAALPPDVV